jgi:hypothetical protein
VGFTKSGSCELDRREILELHSEIVREIQEAYSSKSNKRQ